jgi:hypothetical protein
MVRRGGMKVEVRGTSPYWLSRNGGVETMAMPQRDDSPTPRLRRTGTIEAIKRLDALLEYAVMHGDEAERIREERTGGCVGFAEGRRSRGARPTGARMSVV